MKGLLLAGGTGSRLHPLTKVTSKHLLPVYNKPMIYYSLSVLMLAGVRDILLVSTPRDIPRYQELLGNGSQWGIDLSYIQQEQPRGIVDAMLQCKHWSNNAPIWVMLGDNFFHGRNLTCFLEEIRKKPLSSVFTCTVNNPEEFGTVALNTQGKPVAFTEKPLSANSSLAVTGLYFYQPSWQNVAEKMTFSPRGELEISELNQRLLQYDQIAVNHLANFRWWDLGTPDRIFHLSKCVQEAERQKEEYPGYPEYAALKQGWITVEQVEKIIHYSKKSAYGNALSRLIRAQ